ncbi:kinesin-like protein CG14535 isoform X1 [Episyrphus balteatus]|uniref:kinesin-like protein CG14535 isoform X1 n=1 Tax=Episyrphus balteatus TaxID=286459 RepID=UPI0024859E2D|nr:kinesin-like protein CG14535 isoform X1 [Episyrphus balteatus]
MTGGKQSIAVPIPQPFRPLPPGAGLHHSNQQQHQNQQQHRTMNATYSTGPAVHSFHSSASQQESGSGEGASSRIPMGHQNFNQISKTATNLLHDIYEKHLLNQTMFDMRSSASGMVGGGGGNSQNHDFHLNNLPPAAASKHQQQQHYHHQQQSSFMRDPCSSKQPKGLHFLKLPPPPPQQQMVSTTAPHLHFHFPQGFVEPMCDKASSVLHHQAQQQSQEQQPKYHQLQQHVYETIPERPQNTSHSSHSKAGINNNSTAATSANGHQLSNRNLRRRAPGRGSQKSGAASSGNKKVSSSGLAASDGSVGIGHKQQNGGGGGGGSNPSNQRKHTSAGTGGGGSGIGYEEHYFRQEDFHYRNQQQLPPPPPPKNPPLPSSSNSSAAASHQQRTRADGEHNQRQNQNFTQGQPYPNASSSSSISNGIPTNHVSFAATTTTTGENNSSSVMMMEDYNVREVPLGSAAMHASFVEDNLREAGLLDKPSTKGICSGLPIVFEEETANATSTTMTMNIMPGPGDEINSGGLQDDGIARYPYRNCKIDLMMETAQAMAAAAYYARAAQKLAQGGGSSKSRSTDMAHTSRNGGFCGALQRAPPPLPPGLARRLANKENYGIGKVKVMLRVSDSHMDEEHPHFMAVDKKKRQVTLTDPSAATTVAASTSQERGPMVAAPKMFAFDSLFTAEDQQSDICASALSEVIPAVLEGSDGCLLTIGYPSSGQSRTMLGGIQSSGELGAIPCAISWLYKGINERRQKSGARFSVRVSALGVSATKPDSSSKDLLAAHATESDDSPGVYLRDDFLGGPTELRAPTAERAALFLDAALAGRPQGGLEPAMIFTLHVYQYSLSRKGGVAGGRSRLHLIDLGGCANRNGGLPLSGIGNILLAILSGQRHPPNKDHPLTPLLKDCLAPLTCHVAIMAHVSHTQPHSDALTTIQLASRIHRMRRRKHRFPISSDKAMPVNAGHQSAGSSEGPDPSSSDLSADTVIYMGPCDDATDGEHPPVYLPSLSSGDNRCAMNKVLKGSGAEKPSGATTTTGGGGSGTSKIPAKKTTSQKPQSPVVANRTDSLKRNHTTTGSSSPTPPLNSSTGDQTTIPAQFFSPVHSLKTIPHSASSPKIVAGTLRHSGLSKGSNVPSPKGSPLRRPAVGSATSNPATVVNPDSPLRQITEEQWIDGPRVSRAKVAEARHLMREINHVKQCETWVDGPKSQSARSLTAGNLPATPTQAVGYGFMDSHKKTMIRQWVENQSSQVFQSSAASSPTHQGQQQMQMQQQQQHLRNLTYHLAQFKQKSEDDQHSLESNMEMVHPMGPGLTTAISTTNASAPAEICGVRSGGCGSAKSHFHNRDETDLHSDRSVRSFGGGGGGHLDNQDEEDQDSGPSEVPPALPLIEPLGSREISHESLHRILSRHVSRESLHMQQQHHQQQMMQQQHNYGMSDCGLQVTEEEIARTMGGEHPLAALSHCDMSSFHAGGDAFSDCAMGERTRNQFDQLARLREIFTSQLAMAEVTPVFRVGCDVGSVYSEPAYRFNTGPGSVCSEPPYRPPSPRPPSRSPSQCSLPSLNGIMQIAGMEQYASLRHPDGASDPNLPKAEKSFIEMDEMTEVDEKSALLSKRPSLDHDHITALPPITAQSQLPLLPLNTSSEAYDSGHDSSTPRTSKHSGISRRAESGYHSVATVRDSDESSFTSGLSKEHHNRIVMVKKKRQDKSSLCNWLMNPFTCTYPETEGEISDF